MPQTAGFFRKMKKVKVVYTTLRVEVSLNEIPNSKFDSLLWGLFINYKIADGGVPSLNLLHFIGLGLAKCLHRDVPAVTRKSGERGWGGLAM